MGQGLRRNQQQVHVCSYEEWLQGLCSGHYSPVVPLGLTDLSIRLKPDLPTDEYAVGKGWSDWEVRELGNGVDRVTKMRTACSRSGIGEWQKHAGTRRFAVGEISFVPAGF